MLFVVPARRPATALLGSMLVAAAGLLAGCGCGDGYVDPGAPTQSLALASEPARDGWVAPGGKAVALATTGDVAATGDHVQGGEARRQFFSFDLTALPPGAAIRSATLRLFQAYVGGDPYVTHGVVVVDHLVYDTLDASDYDRPALTSALGTLSSDAALGFKTLDVTSALLADLSASRPRTQLRLRWSLRDRDGDPADDEACFVDAEDLYSTRAVPQLIVVYATP